MLKIPPFLLSLFKPLLPQKTECLLRDDDDFCVAMPASTGIIYFINRTGFEILNLCNGENSIGEILMLINKQYSDIDYETIARNTVEIMRDLEEFRIIYFRK